ncbi:hypothetical protein ACFVYE_37855 [Streptomyces sp. NPDC058239]|uniref:ISAzo13-like element transposase-related protein n=1 Tax=Streptomyces sp. NPDC058239 TaxID=3346395 RepID=UPI0036E28E3B
MEHRLFSHITMNWRGRPLTSHDVVVNAIAATRTRSGLRVEAELDTCRYPLGISISKAQLKSLPIEYHNTHGIWNYTVRPAGHLNEEPAQVTDHDTARRQVLDLLAEPALTGMSRDEMAALAGKLAPELGSLREERLHRKRGGPRRPPSSLPVTFTKAATTTPTRPSSQ